MKAHSWAYGRLMAALDWLDSPAGRLPMTALLVVVGLGLILAERRADRKARGE